MHYKKLIENERYQIYSLIKAGNTQKEIVSILNRSSSTICREIARNKGLKGYRPKQAQRMTETLRSTVYKAQKVTEEVYDWIVCLIRQELSSQQVSAYIKKHKKVSLHHENIYQLIYADKAQDGDPYTHLRIGSKSYRKRYGQYDRRGIIRNRVSINERPAVVDRKNRVGDWEGDTIVGKRRQSSLTGMPDQVS